MLRKSGLFSARALANASSDHECQSTGLNWCWRRYGDFSRASRFGIVCLTGVVDTMLSFFPRLAFSDRVFPALFGSLRPVAGGEYIHTDQNEHTSRSQTGKRQLDSRDGVGTDSSPQYSILQNPYGDEAVPAPFLEFSWGSWQLLTLTVPPPRRGKNELNPRNGWSTSALVRLRTCSRRTGME